MGNFPKQLVSRISAINSRKYTFFFHRLRSQPSGMSQKIHEMATIGAALDTDGVGFCWRVFFVRWIFFLFLQVNKQKKWSKVEVLENFWLHVLKKCVVCIFHTYHLQYIWDMTEYMIIMCWYASPISIPTLVHLASSCGAWLCCLTLRSCSVLCLSQISTNSYYADPQVVQLVYINWAMKKNSLFRVYRALYYTVKLEL